MSAPDWTAAPVSAADDASVRRCWRVDMHLDWGVRCMSDGEMLYDLALSTAHEAIDGVRREWPRRPLPALFHARLDLATTGSWVDVVFSELAVEPLGPEGEHTAPLPVPIRGG